MLTTLCVRATGCFSQTMSGAACVQKGEQLEELPSADLVAGCDGVNSAAGLSCKVFVFFSLCLPLESRLTWKSVQHAAQSCNRDQSC